MNQKSVDGYTQSTSISQDQYLSVPEFKSSVSFGDLISALFGEAEPVCRLLRIINWWYIAPFTGLIVAVSRLILIINPEICYLYAQNQVQGLDVTLPEAMAAEVAKSWINIIIYPICFTMLFAAMSSLILKVSQMLKGKGDFHHHFGMVNIAAAIWVLGQLVGYIFIRVPGVWGIVDLRDLTPGIGLGLLPWFSVEQIGSFAREMVRSFDLFGIWAVLLGTAMLNAVNGFGRLKTFCLVVGYYGIFIALRWFIEWAGYNF